jgi:hypothetical protein
MGPNGSGSCGGRIRSTYDAMRQSNTWGIIGHLWAARCTNHGLLTAEFRQRSHSTRSKVRGLLPHVAKRSRQGHLSSIVHLGNHPGVPALLVWGRICESPSRFGHLWSRCQIVSIPRHPDVRRGRRSQSRVNRWSGGSGLVERLPVTSASTVQVRFAQNLTWVRGRAAWSPRDGKPDRRSAGRPSPGSRAVSERRSTKWSAQLHTKLPFHSRHAHGASGGPWILRKT